MSYLFYEVMIIILFLLFSIIVIMNNDKVTIKDILKSKKKLLLIFILIIGFSIRMIGFEKIPCGLEQDEVSIGYESYSILNYGVDQNGNTIPVLLKVWGTGQNALYAYLLMPFIKIFGLSPFSVRLPMAIIGCLTIFITLLFILKNKKIDENKRLIIITLISIVPWLITKSRWGLESNIFPDLVYYGILLLYFGIKNKKYLKYSSILFGLSCYAYGTAYLYIPLFIFISYIYLYVKKYISIKEILINLLIIILISMPLIIFVIINYFDLHTIKLFNIFTIPKLEDSRISQVTILNGNFSLNNIFNNLKKTSNILINNIDTRPINYVSNYGLFYKYSIPFIIIGIYYSFKNKEIFYKLINFSFIVSIILCMFIDANINRVNILWMNLLIYYIYSFIVIYNLKKDIVYILLFINIVLFGSFSKYYIYNYNNDIDLYTNDSLIGAINYTKKLDYDKLYFPTKSDRQYIYYLYAYKVNPKSFSKERKYKVSERGEYKYSKYKNVYFDYQTNLKENNVYVYDYNMLRYVENMDEFHVKYFKNYVVIY